LRAILSTILSIISSSLKLIMKVWNMF
jgi:hypothetical protein